jgi:hypothetical protein
MVKGPKEVVFPGATPSHRAPTAKRYHDVTARTRLCQWGAFRSTHGAGWPFAQASPFALARHS